MAEQQENVIRVLRVYEFTGPRSVVEQQVLGSLRDGTHTRMRSKNTGQYSDELVIRVATVGDFSEKVPPAQVEPFAPLLPVRSFPYGINPGEDKHAADNGLAHWSCVSPRSNGWWVRKDGRTLIPRLGSITLEELAKYDERNPYEPE